MAKKLQIYGRILSPFVTRVALAAKAKGFPYELSLPEDGLKTPAYLKKNPFGKIPLLIDGKTTVYELTVIVEYLEARSRSKRLVPANAKAAAQARLVAAVSAEYVQGPSVKLFRHKRGTATEPVDEQATIAELEKGLATLNQIMPKGKFAGGPKFSIGDCFAAPALMFAERVCELFNVGAGVKANPKVVRYWAAIQKDKTAKSILDDMRVQMEQALAGQLPALK